jgi:hypothetical protein
MVCITVCIIVDPEILSISVSKELKIFETCISHSRDTFMLENHSVQITYTSPCVEWRPANISKVMPEESAHTIVSGIPWSTYTTKVISETMAIRCWQNKIKRNNSPL